MTNAQINGNRTEMENIMKYAVRSHQYGAGFSNHDDVETIEAGRAEIRRMVADGEYIQQNALNSIWIEDAATDERVFEIGSPDAMAADALDAAREAYYEALAAADALAADAAREAYAKVVAA